MTNNIGQNNNSLSRFQKSPGDTIQDIKDHTSNIPSEIGDHTDFTSVKSAANNFDSNKSMDWLAVGASAVGTYTAERGLRVGVERLCKNGENSLLAKFTNSKIFDNKVFDGIGSGLNRVTSFLSRGKFCEQIKNGLNLKNEMHTGFSTGNTVQSLEKNIAGNINKVNNENKLNVFNMAGKAIPKSIRKLIINIDNFLGIDSISLKSIQNNSGIKDKFLKGIQSNSGILPTLLWGGTAVYNTIKAPSDKFQTFMEDVIAGIGGWMISSYIMGEISKGAAGLAKKINPKELNWASKVPAWILQKSAKILGAGIKEKPVVETATKLAGKLSGPAGGLLRILLFFTVVMPTCEKILRKTSRKVFGAPKYRVEKEKADKEKAAKEKAEKAAKTAAAGNPSAQATANPTSQAPAPLAPTAQNTAVPAKIAQTPLDSDSIIKQMTTPPLLAPKNAKVSNQEDITNLTGQPKNSKQELTENQQEDQPKRNYIPSAEPFKSGPNPVGEEINKIGNSIDQDLKDVENIKSGKFDR